MLRRQCGGPPRLTVVSQNPVKAHLVVVKPEMRRTLNLRPLARQKHLREVGENQIAGLAKRWAVLGQNKRPAHECAVWRCAVLVSGHVHGYGIVRADRERHRGELDETIAVGEPHRVFDAARVQPLPHGDYVLPLYRISGHAPHGYGARRIQYAQAHPGTGAVDNVVGHHVVQGFGEHFGEHRRH